jgi:hypothetical protein
MGAELGRTAKPSWEGPVGVEDGDELVEVGETSGLAGLFRLADAGDVVGVTGSCIVG